MPEQSKMLLDVKDLWCHYAGAEVLKGISIGIPEGKIITIIGGNGAGKTTTMRAISGLKRPTSGVITFRDERIDVLSPQAVVRRGIVQVPEGRQLFPYMSVIDNLRVGSYLQKDKEQVRESLEDVFAHFPVLRERKRQKANTLSGGEQQMLAIGRALMANPKLLLLDEPSLGLSPMNVLEIGKIVRSINERGISVVLVEQNARLALGVAHHAYVLETGSVVLAGEAQELAKSDHVRKAYLGK
jgi:branched-chain amino acid transport system ATP-binding protein